MGEAWLAVMPVGINVTDRLVTKRGETVISTTLSYTLRKLGVTELAEFRLVAPGHARDHLKPCGEGRKQAVLKTKDLPLVALGRTWSQV